MTFIPYGHQCIGDDDVEVVSKILKGDWLTQGPSVAAFEKALADYVGVKHVVTFCNGTAALHGAMYAAGVKDGSEIITSPITFAATSNSAIYEGGKPIFADIDEESGCLDPEKVRSIISESTKVIAPVSYSGYPVDIKPFMDMAESCGAVVIEDGCHALGASRNGVKVGVEAHMTAFSFHPVKHITTGEGGAIATNDDQLASRLSLFRTHGITKDPASMTKEPDGPWYNEMIDLGYNYRLTDIQSALGLSQLAKLDSFVEVRRSIAARYDEAFAALDSVVTPASHPGHGYHLYALRVEPEIKRGLFEYMRSHDIGVQVHYPPVHLHPYYKNNFGYKEGDFPLAERFYSMEISLPIYPGLTESDQDRVIKTIVEYISRNKNQ